MRFVSFLILLIGIKASAAINLTPPFEQGSWTPIIFFSTSQPTSVTYTTQAGRYTRFNDTVCVQAYMLLASITTGANNGAGNVYVSGTPYSTVATTAPCGGVTVTSKSAWTTSGPAFGQCLAAGSQAFEMLIDSGTGVTNLTRTNVAGTTGVSIEGCYRMQ